MADNEEISARFREILGMTDGGTTGGRGRMSLPDEIMDSLAGDAAQESLARDRLIMEMRKQDNARHDPRFVPIDLVEMESDDVDAFLTHARKKIIKRSKPTRQACCAKIGGVLDHLMGPAGGEHGETQGNRDPGADEPTGGADQVAESDDLLDFVADEFFYFEHDFDCRFSQPGYEHKPDPLAEAKFIGGAIKKPGALRAHFGVRGDETIPVEKAKDEYEALTKKAEGKATLTGDEMKLFKRLQLFLKVLKPAAVAKQEESHATVAAESAPMNSSRTVSALASFTESTVDAYAAAQAGSGKGAPDPSQLKVGPEAGAVTRRERDDNKDYQTAPTPAKSGLLKVAGKPGHVGTRGQDRGNPIGEAATGAKPSRSAVALSHFMEATGQYEAAKKRLDLRGKDAGALEASERAKQPYGLPPKPAKDERASADVYDAGGKKPRYERDADPIGGGNESDAAGSRLKK